MKSGLEIVRKEKKKFKSKSRGRKKPLDDGKNKKLK